MNVIHFEKPIQHPLEGSASILGSIGLFFLVGLGEDESDCLSGLDVFNFFVSIFMRGFFGALGTLKVDNTDYLKAVLLLASGLCLSVGLVSTKKSTNKSFF